MPIARTAAPLATAPASGREEGAEDAMPYAEGRTYHAADSHVMETPDWLVPYADPGVRERLKPLFVAAVKPGEETMIEQARRRHLDPAERERAADELMLRKNWNAMGSFVREDRPRALDLLGFSNQLVFNTFLNPYLLDAERKDDPDFAYGLARAHNRAMVLRRSASPRHRLRAARRLRAGARDGGGGHRDGRQGAARPLGLPGTPLAEPRGALPGVGDCAGSPHPDRAARGRRRAAPRPALLRERPPAGAGLPRRGGELPLRRLHGDPLPAHADALDAHHRRHPRPLPALEDRRHRAGCRVGPELDAPARHHGRRLQQERGAVEAPPAPPERIRAAPDPRHALRARARRLDHRAGGRGGVPLLLRPPARRGRAEPARADGPRPTTRDAPARSRAPTRSRARGSADTSGPADDASADSPSSAGSGARARGPPPSRAPSRRRPSGGRTRRPC